MFPKLKEQFSLENYFLLVIFLLPVYLFRFSILSFPTTLWEILAGVAIIIAVWKIKKEDNLALTGYEKKIIFLFLLIIIGLVLGMAKSGNYSIGLGIIRGWFLAPFLFAFLANKIIKNKKRAYYSLYLSAFFVSAIALAYKISGVVTYDGRLQAFYNSPNYLAMYLAPAIIIGILELNSWKFQELSSRRKKLFLVCSFLFILVSLFFTYSYAAWVSVALAIAIVFLLNNKFSKKYLIIFFSIFLVLIFLLKDTTKFNDLVNLNNRSSLASRMMIWNSAGKILKDNYMIGIGPGNFEAKYLEYQKYFPPYLQWAVPHPHNLYLTFWLSAGILGLVSFLAILYLFFKNVETRHCLVSTEMGCIASAVVIYFLLHGLVDTTYFKNDLAVVFWLMILAV